MAKKKNSMSQFAVIGMGTFGRSLASALSEGGKEVLAIDIDEEKINAVSESVTYAVTADATEDNVLKKLALSSFDAVIVCVGEIQSSILITLGLKDIGCKQVVVKAINSKHRLVLEKIGADMIVEPEIEMAYKMANRLINKRLNDLMEINGNYSIIESAVPESWIGKTLAELNLRGRYGVNVIFVISGADEDVISPSPTTTFSNDDKILVAGTNNDIAKFIQKS